MIVTTTSVLRFDPVSGQTAVISAFANLANTLPVSQGTLPGQILQTAVATSADGMTVWGIGGANTGSQVVFRYDARVNALAGGAYVTSPPLLPRVSVAADGSSAMIGYSLIDAGGNIQGRYPNVIASNTITGSAIDSKNGIIYGQFPDANQPTGPATFSSTPAGSTSSVKLPALLLMDPNHLAVHDRLIMPEDIVGRAVLNAAGTMLYAISESGVMALPVGSLNKYNRIAASAGRCAGFDQFLQSYRGDAKFHGYRSRWQPHRFPVSTSQTGVSISQSSGVTPATVRCERRPQLHSRAPAARPQ